MPVDGPLQWSFWSLSNEDVWQKEKKTTKTIDSCCCNSLSPSVFLSICLYPFIPVILSVSSYSVCSRHRPSLQIPAGAPAPWGCSSVWPAPGSTATSPTSARSSPWASPTGRTTRCRWDHRSQQQTSTHFISMNRLLKLTARKRMNDERFL